MSKRLISYLLTFALVFSMMPLQVFADTPLQVVTVDKTMVKTGEEVHVTVKVPEGIETAGSFTIRLAFDKAKFEVVSRAKPGKLNVTDSWGDPDTINLTANSVAQANTSGELTAGGMYEMNTIEVAGVTVIDAVLKAKTTGAAAMTFSKFEVTKSEGGTQYILKEANIATPPVVTVYEELAAAQAITGMVAPSKNGTAIEAGALTAPANTTINSLTWTPAPVAGKFAAETVYTATVNVAANTGYAFAAETAFTVDGENWTAEKQENGSYNLTKTFPATLGKELTGIEITTPATKTDYLVGDNFDKTGMVVTGTYDDASTAAVEFTVTDGDNLQFGKTSVTVQVGGFTKTQAITVKKDLTKTTVTVGDLVYTGSEQTATVTVKDGDETVNAANYDVAGANGTAVGKYTATVTGKGDYVGEKTVEWNITEADITANDYTLTLVKGGATHTLVDSALNIATVGGQTAAVEYKLNGDCVELNGKVLTAKAVGTATITATITAPNHKTLTKTITVNVTEKLLANVTLDVIKSEQVYDKADHALSEFVKPATVDQVGGELTYTLNGEAATLDTVIKNVGEYVITANYVSDTHAGTASQTVVIKKAPVAVPTAAAGLIYNGSEQTGVAANDLYKVEGGAATNAGDYKAIVTLNDAANYEWASAFNGEIEWSIAKKNVTVAIADIAAVVYTGTAHEPAVTVTPAELTKDVDYTVAYANNINAGTAAVTVTAVESSNYTFTEATKNFTINKADYAGEKTAEKPVLINKEAAYSVDLSGLLNGIEGAEIVTATAAANDIINGAVAVEGKSVNFTSKSVAEEGKTAVVTVEVKSTNYNNFDITLTLTTVNKTPVVVSGVAMDAASYTYGDTVGYTGTPVAKLGEEEKAVEFVYEWMQGGTKLDATPTNAGNYTLVVKVADSDETYMGQQEIAFTINKAPVAIPTAVAGLTWNGNVQTGVVDGDLYSITGNTAADAGNYNAVATLDDAANYMWADNTVADKTIAWSIAVLKVDAPAQKAPVTYNGKAQTYGLVGNAHYTVETVTQTNAGEYNVKIELQDKVNTTWADGTTADLTHKFIINKATIVIKANDQEVVVNEKTLPALSYTVSGLAEGESLAQNPTIKYASTPNLDKAGTVDIIVSDAVAPNANYNAIQYVNGTLTIYEAVGEPIYGVKIEESENGTVKTSARHAEEGDKITLTVAPDRGYELVELIVTDGRGREIKLTQKGDDKFTFKMPAGQVKVEAVFEKIGGEEELDNPFIDVAEKDYFYDAVLWAAENGITNGMSAYEFMPGVICNRAQVVTFLWRAAGCPEPETMVMPFADVAEGAYYYDAVLWAVENGITNGMSATEFAPNATVTRGQTVTFLWRAENGNVAEGETSFIDVPADAYYASAVEWAVRNGITNGMSATEFAPMSGCTRGQIVTFLYRTFAK